MDLFQKILNKFKGLHYPQEYLCFSKESFQQPLHIYLASDGKLIKEVTHEHIFAGYSPLIFALHSSTIGNKSSLPDDIDIIFSRLPMQQNDIPGNRDALAFISMKLIRKQSAGDNTVFYYEGIKGEHHFLSTFHQSIIELYNKLYNNKSGNIYLQGNLYKQVQIAYAAPRVISLITAGNNNLYNLFPTDLHGQVNEEYYISSLRHLGKACKQVEESGKIVVSQIHTDAYKTAYSLGKNHMHDLQSKEHFPFSNSVSVNLKLPLPNTVLNYYELELKESFIHGIHKVFLYKILNREFVNNKPFTLAHIHNSYATWRHYHNLQDKFLIR